MDNLEPDSAVSGITRRRLLTLLSRLPLAGLVAGCEERDRVAPGISDDLILVRGWILKPSDIRER